MFDLVLATRNAHKVSEIRAILGEGFHCHSLNDLRGAPTTIEDAGTFGGNATKKAVELARWISASRPSPLAARPSPLHVLADDSGLEVDALGGAPGVHSARFAATDEDAGGLHGAVSGNSSDADNNSKLLRLLKDVPLAKRTARFRCVLALTPVLVGTREGSSPVCYVDEAELQSELFDGVCDGRIDFAPRGQGGFGYDPIFIPEGYQQSFAELGEEVKNKLSHRARALARLRERLVKRSLPP